MIITLDGPSGSGKSTVSHLLARHFNIPCLDTGAMYRSVAWRALENKIDLDNEISLVALTQKLKFKFGFEGETAFVELTDEAGRKTRLGREIRTPEVSLAASRVAKLKKVRAVLVQQQQEIGMDEGAVVEGRDAGTVIFPKAKYKFYMTASDDERARRRHLELVEKLGSAAPSLADVQREMLQRDHQDSSRVESPLVAAKDADKIDTTGLALEAVVDVIVKKVKKEIRAS